MARGTRHPPCRHCVCSRRSAGLEVVPQERTGVAKRPTTLLQARIPQVPGMDHVGPDFERHEYALRSRLGGQAHRIIQQRLGRTNLDERRRQSLKVGKENGDSRVPPVDRRRRVLRGRPYE